MSLTRSRRLASGKVTATGDVTVYTVPAGKVVLLKGIVVQNQSGAAELTYLSLVHAGNYTNLLQRALAIAEVYAPVSPWHVLEAGDSIHLNVAHANVVLYWLSGAELTAP